MCHSDPVSWWKTLPYWNCETWTKNSLQILKNESKNERNFLPYSRKCTSNLSWYFLALTSIITFIDYQRSWWMPSSNRCSYQANKARQLVSAGNHTQCSRLSRLKTDHSMGNKTELPKFELSSWSHSERLVIIFSMNLSSEVLLNIFVSFSQKKMFNFHECWGLEYFRKWAGTGHGIGDLEVSIHVHQRGGEGTSL